MAARTILAISLFSFANGLSSAISALKKLETGSNSERVLLDVEKGDLVFASHLSVDEIRSQIWSGQGRLEDLSTSSFIRLPSQHRQPFGSWNSSGFINLPHAGPPHAELRSTRGNSVTDKITDFVGQDSSSGARDLWEYSSMSEKKKNVTVWVAGWPRSGSTTVFEMVLAAALAHPEDAKRIHGRIQSQSADAAKHFGLFEPCHWGFGGGTTPDDMTDPWLKEDCKQMMTQMIACNFTGINFLFGWSKYSGKHTDISGIDDKRVQYSQQLARDTCLASELVVYKTVSDFGKKIDNIIPMLNANPHLKVIVPVRDPRAIYSSWKARKTWGADISTLRSICDQELENSKQQHPQLRRLFFEKLATDPVDVMMRLYEWLDLPFGEPQAAWIGETFNATCKGSGGGEAFQTCHQDSSEPLNRWKKEFLAVEHEAFRKHPSCIALSKSQQYADYAPV